MREVLAQLEEITRITKSVEFEKNNPMTFFTHLQYLSTERYLKLLVDGESKMENGCFFLGGNNLFQKKIIEVL